MPATNGTDAPPLFYRMTVSAVDCFDGPLNCTFVESRANNFFITVRDFNCTNGCYADISAGIKPSTMYQLRLASVTSLGASFQSLAFTTTTPATVPEMDDEAGPAVSTVTSDSISVSWGEYVSHGDPITE
jgi:hypothetical protein